MNGGIPIDTKVRAQWTGIMKNEPRDNVPFIASDLSNRTRKGLINHSNGCRQNEAQSYEVAFLPRNN
ncbi:hypothetical protein ACTXT7_000975 [Hymenolepis weldensis]